MLKDKKKLIIIIAAVAVVLLAGAGSLFFVLKVKGGDRPPTPPDHYLTKKEELSSITAIVGERNYEPVEVEAKQDAETGTEPADGTEDGAETEAETGTGGGAAEGTAAETPAEETEAETETFLSVEKYRYVDVENAEEDILSYVDYLKNDKEFIDIKEDTAQPLETEEQPEEEESETEAGDGIVNVYELAGPSENPAQYVSVVIEQGTDSYLITATVMNESWNAYMKGLLVSEKEKVEQARITPKEEKTSIEDAEDSVRNLGDKKLGLDKAADQYEFITDPALIYVDGQYYYSVKVYERQEGSGQIYVGGYLLEQEKGTVDYKYNESDGTITPIE